MCSGPPLDAQREERWPGQTETNAAGAPSLKVKRQPWETDSDYEDMEMIFGEHMGPVDHDHDESDVIKGYEVAQGATGYDIAEGAMGARV